MGMNPAANLDFGALFIDAGKFLNQRRRLWLLGLLVTGWGGAAVVLVRLLLATGVLQLPTPAAPFDFDPFFFISLLFVSLVVGLAAWLVALVADAAIITAAGSEAERAPGALLREGMRALGRLVVIDALLFFPLFLLSVAGIVVPAATVIIAAVRSSAGSELNAILLVGFGATMALFCLALPVGGMTLLLRLLSFRLAVLDGDGAVMAVRRAWLIIRARWLSLLVVGAGLFVVRNVVGLLITAFSLPFFFVEISNVAAGGTSGAGAISFVLQVLLTLLTVALSAVRYCYGATVWTLAIRQWRGAGKGQAA